MLAAARRGWCHVLSLLSCAARPGGARPAARSHVLLFLALTALSGASGACSSAAGGQGPDGPEQPPTAAQVAQARQALAARAQAGEAEAQFRLGLYRQYAEPVLDGTAPDYAAVVDLYRRAARQGHLKAGFALGRMYDQGLGVEENLAQAIRWYRPSAESGHAEAMARLGAAYAAYGYGKEAVDWSTRAANLGNPIALNTLGALHHAGRGVSRDFALARGYYQKAADAGDCYALQNIGGLYYNGDGVKQDGREAQAWFDRAIACNENLRTGAEAFLARIRSGRLPTGNETTPRRADRPAAPRRTGSIEADPWGIAVVAVVAVVVLAAAAAGPPAAERPPAGEWKAKYWCRTYHEDPPIGIPGGPRTVTDCYDRNGGIYRRGGVTDPCDGVNGWCDNYGFGPAPGFFR